jgi:predicted peptidase
MQAVDVLATEYPIDMNRLYVAGISMGGFATWYLLSSLPDIFAAAIAVCGGGLTEFASKIKDVPIWAFHGAQDAVVPVRWSRDMIQAIRAAGGTPRYTEYSGVGHDAWTPAFAEPELLQWLFQQRRG